MTTPPQSPLNPRDFVELLDDLIQRRATMKVYASHPMEHEECEIIKRQLTDYLLDIDKRKEV